MMKHNFEFTINAHIGILHYMALQDVCSDTLSEYGFNYTMVAHDNTIYLVVNDNGDIDADTLGACINEIGTKMSNYIKNNIEIPES